MSESKHTSEPWAFNNEEGGCRAIKGGKYGSHRQGQYMEIAYTVGLSNDERDKANARRIVAAVNACKGISTEALEAGVVAEMVVLLGKFAAEADQWADAVPDDYRSPCIEPGAKSAHPGSETVFTVGDTRKARAILAKIGGAS